MFDVNITLFIHICAQMSVVRYYYSSTSAISRRTHFGGRVLQMIITLMTTTKAFSAAKP